MYYCINSGNVPLIIDLYKIRDIGTTISKGVVAHEPGFKTQCDLGYKPVKNHITPGTETEDLLGTATISVYAIGRDPETGEELCKSNTLTRTWKVGKDSPWPIPEESQLAGTLTVAPGYESSDPAGYQLGEPVSTVLTVENVGPIDLESFTVSDPWDDTSFSDGPIAVSGTKSYVRADVTVTEDDVEKGYIEFPMITIKWTDPDTGKERTAFAGPLHLTVLKKTGLLLKKDVAFKPGNMIYPLPAVMVPMNMTVIVSRFGIISPFRRALFVNPANSRPPLNSTVTCPTVRFIEFSNCISARPVAPGSKFSVAGLKLTTGVIVNTVASVLSTSTAPPSWSLALKPLRAMVLPSASASVAFTLM